MDGANKKRREVRLGCKSVGEVVARAQSERSHRDLLEISVEGSDGREDGVVKANKITLSSGREVRGGSGNLDAKDKWIFCLKAA